MNKLSKILTIFLALFLTNNVFADCDDTTRVNLSKKAANIKMIYEVETGELENYTKADCESGDDCDLTYEYFKISVLNLNEDFNVQIKNNLNSNVYNYDNTNLDSNGIVSFDWKNVMKMTTFTMDIYASSNTSCSGEKITTYYLATPRKNEFASYLICDEAKDYYLCEDYVTFEEMSLGEFYTQINEYIEKSETKKEEKTKEDKSFWNTLIKFLNNYKLYIIGGGILIIALITIIIVVRKRR